MKRTIIVAIALLGINPPGSAVAAGYREQWDLDQDRVVRDTIIPIASRLEGGAALKATFEKALAWDGSAVPGLIALLDHRLLDVATSAAQQLGRFPGTEAAAVLKQRLANDPRRPMRIVAMMALGRMRDPDAAALAAQAVRGSDLAMKGAGGVALGLIGDSHHVGVMLEYLDDRKAAGQPPDEEAFEILAAMGDPPGATMVTDRLVAEANDKGSAIDVRYAAAFTVEKMGHAGLVQKLLDLNDADSTWRNMLSLVGIITRFATSRGIALENQAALDSVLAQADKNESGEDYWGRPLRVRFVSPHVFHVVSDGPDRTPATADDMSTAESFDSYEERGFGDVF